MSANTEWVRKTRRERLMLLDPVCSGLQINSGQRACTSLSTGSCSLDVFWNRDRHTERVRERQRQRQRKRERERERDTAHSMKWFGLCEFLHLVSVFRTIQVVLKSPAPLIDSANPAVSRTWGWSSSCLYTVFILCFTTCPKTQQLRDIYWLISSSA